MFSYYGSKSKIVNLYPLPNFGKIIEPFAGSARYSLKYWENDVDLYDVSPYVYEVWRYLLEASPSNILGLPLVESKVSIKDYSLTDAEKWLIGFHLCRGKAVPRHIGHGQNSWERDRQRIADNLYKIKHWRIFQQSYETIPNERATWFIDPPYKAVQERKGNTDRYKNWYVDSCQLTEFIKNREGLSIVCEGSGAEWLPVELLTEVNTNTNSKTTKKNKEYIYIQNN